MSSNNGSDAEVVAELLYDGLKQRHPVGDKVDILHLKELASEYISTVGANCRPTEVLRALEKSGSVSRWKEEFRVL